MGLAVGGLQSGGGGAASSLTPGATGTDLTLSSSSTALQFISTQATGLDAFKVTTNGARFHFGAGATDYASSDGTIVTFAGALTTAGAFNAGTSVTAAGSVNAGLTQGFGLGGNLVLFEGTAAGTTAGQEYIRSQVANGGTAVGVTLCNANTLTTAGAHIVEFKAGTFNSAVTAFIDKDGTYSGFGLALSDQISLTSYTDDSANSGNRTVNKVRGKSAVAIAAATCVITNSFVTANSQILVTLEFADATATSIKCCIPAAGSFTLTVIAAATAATKFSWTVIN